ncbi:TcaA NTF2-like domain-containing protein [Pontibacillus salipaludis]|uniref:TcaA NTF2-like domain-containing protein n=1 Tax=Pontibacillus salipaludis TaxID=1697394 RepID=UPI0031E8EAD3
MKFCTQCGHKLQEGQSFCTECGTPFDANEQSATSDAPQQPKAPMSKKKKVMWTVGAVLAVALISTHLILSSLFDPMKTVQAMDRAISDDQAEAFFEEVSLDEDALIIQDTYLDYIEGEGWSDIRDQFVESIHNEESFDQAIYGRYGGELFKVKKEKVLGIYDTYEFVAIPTEVSILTNVENSTLTIGDDHTVETTTPYEYVSAMKAYPGEYPIVGKAANPFGEFTLEGTLPVEQNDDHYQEFEAEFSTAYYSLDTNEENAILYINGESTEKKLGEFEGEIGPIPTDSSLELQAGWTGEDGKELLTEKVTPQNAPYGTMHFDIQHPVKQDPMMKERAVIHYQDFRIAYEDALNSRDYTTVAPYLLPGSKADLELEDYIGDLEDENYTYDFKENDVTNVVFVDDTTISLSSNESFVFTNHKGDQTHYERSKTYTIVYKDGAYTIEEIDIFDTDRDSL